MFEVDTVDDCLELGSFLFHEGLHRRVDLHLGTGTHADCKEEREGYDLFG